MENLTETTTSHARHPRPDHVSPEWVVDLDIYALPRSAEDPHLAWLDLLEDARAPLLWAPYHGGYWIPTNARIVAKIQRDAKSFSSDPPTVPDRGTRLLPLECDPPRHGQYRRTIDPLFTPKALVALEPQMRQLAIGLIEELVDDGACEFILQFALRFPVTVVLQILGLPIEDGIWLNKTTDDVIRHPEVEAKMKAYAAIEAYLDTWLDRRLAEPTGDGISLIAHGTIEGCPYTREEMRSQGMLLILGGVDALAMVMGFIARHLALNPDDLAYVKANLDRLDPIIHELTRRFSGANMFRRITQDMELEGIQVKAGEMIAISPVFYNLRDEIFPDAAKVDFTRPDKQLHLSFGTGPHTCIGAALARLEIRIFLQEWLKRIPQFRIKDGSAPRLRASIVPAIDHLHLEWPANHDPRRRGTPSNAE